MENKVLMNDTTLRDGRYIWNAMGVSENIIKASWQALIDNIYFKLRRNQAEETRFD